MSASPNLKLPFIDANQNQKSVTHNEALRALDALVNLRVASTTLTAPPASPADGQCWIVASGATGAWSGKDLNVAAWQDGAWAFYPPNPGFVAYVDALGGALMWNGTAWASLLGAVSQLQLSALGLGTAADAGNPLSAKLNSALFAALPTTASGTGDVRVKLSKQAGSNTASFLFQDNFSGRAELGLTGDDDFHVKVSPDGATFYDAIKITAASGSVTFLGAPSHPTPSAGDSSTKSATTAFVAGAVAAPFARTQVNDANYTVLTTDRTLAVIALTAARTLTLPAASAYPQVATLTILDESGSCSPTAAITVARAGSDTINGAASAVLSSPNAYLALQSNGANKWTIVDQPSGVVSGLNGGPLAGFRNRLINGSFAINQRVQTSGTALAAAAYGHDRWKAGASGSTYTFAASQPDTTVTITAGTLTQVVEAANIEGGTYALSWTGTATARAYQGAATGAYASSPILLTGLPGGANTTVEFGTGTLGKVQFEPGPIATPFERRPVGIELGLCQRYFEKSYDQGTAPGAASGPGGPAVFVLGLPSALYTGGASVGFKAVKRTDPIVTLYSLPTGAAGKVRDYMNSTDVTGTATNVGEEGFFWYAAGSAAATGFNFECQWTASAEL